MKVGAFADPTFPPPMGSGFEEYRHPWAMNVAALPMPLRHQNSGGLARSANHTKRKDHAKPDTESLDVALQSARSSFPDDEHDSANHRWMSCTDRGIGMRAVPAARGHNCGTGGDVAPRDQRRAGNDAGLQPKDPREDHDARQGGDPLRDAQLRGWRAHRGDDAESSTTTSTTSAASRSSSTSFPPLRWKGCAWAPSKRGAQIKSNQAIIFDQLMDSNPLYLTGNTDTVYCMVFLDLEADGPTVVEIPPGCGPGTVDDAFFRFVIDMGAPGPDAGKGGKYLILPPDYKGEMPKDKKDGGEYFVAQSTSYVNWVPLRGFLVDGKPDAAAKMFKDGVKVYPLSKAANPPEDGVHQRLEEAVQHHPRQRLRVLRGARSRDPEGADRLPRPGTARPRGQHRHREGQEVRAR